MSLARTNDEVRLEPRHRWIELFSDVAEFARAIAPTAFVGPGLRNDPAAITGAILLGDEVGLGPMQSLSKIAVINGRPTLAAETLRALIQREGHELWIEEATVTRVTVAGRRKGSDQIQRFTWTMDDAKRAGLAGKQSWRTYPRQMLLARASAELARAVFADVIGGLAATEEIEDTGDDSSPPPDAPETPQKPTTRRRRPRQGKPPVIAPAPPTGSQDEPPAPPLPGEGPEGEPPPKATEPQLRKLFALLRENGLENRDDRLDWANKRLQRTVVSASELTDIEATQLISELESQAKEQETEQKLEENERASEQSGAQEQLLEPPAMHTETLWWMVHEADVSQVWLQECLREIRLADVPERVTEATLRRLDRAQASKLAEHLNIEIDRLRQEG